jgi:hypothetical protein
MKAFAIICFLFMGQLCLAQCRESSVFDMHIFERPAYKNYDTIYFTATLYDIGKVQQGTLLTQLNAKGLLKKREYKTAIKFTPLQTNLSLYLPYKDIDLATYRTLVMNQNANKHICIRGIIIKGFEMIRKEPFFIIDQVWFKD